MFNGRVLILSPHMDDEVLGCGGLMAQIDPMNLHVHYMTDQHPMVGKQSHEECEKVRSVLNYRSTVFQYATNELALTPIVKHIHNIEIFINEQKTDTLLIPCPDYNQDHRVVFEAAITASRVHDKNHYVKNILAYESPCTQQTNRLDGGFQPQVFLPIDIDKKLELYQMYASQVRAHRSLDYVRHLAGVRGMQCGKLYAEAFQVIRITA